jgi:hypothetical protein
MLLKSPQSLAETAVAISASFHTDGRYREFYGKSGGKYGGFTGIWIMVATAAEIFERASKEIGNEVWMEYDFVASVDAVAGFLYDHGCPPLLKQCVDLIKDHRV